MAVNPYGDQFTGGSRNSSSGGGSGAYSAQFSRRSSRSSGSRQDDLNNLTRRTEMLMMFAPELADDPTTLLSLARSTMPDEQLASASSRLLSRTMYESAARSLAESAPDMQEAQWALMLRDNPGRAQMLRQAGYTPPSEQSDNDDGGWGSIGIGAPTWIPKIGGRHFTLGGGAGVVGAVGSVVAAPLEMMNRGTRAAGSFVFEGFEKIENNVTNVPRALDRASSDTNYNMIARFDSELRARTETELGHEIDDATWRASVRGIVEEPPKLPSWAGIPQPQLAKGGILDESIRQIASEHAGRMEAQGVKQSLNVWEAWDETWDGDTYIDPIRETRVVDDQFEGDWDKLELARKLMAGQTLEEIAAQKFDPSAAPDDYLGEMRRLLDLQGGDDNAAVEQFQDGVKDLGMAKYSIGREMARSSGFDEGTTPYSVLSGAMDAGIILFVDPTLAVGKAYRGARALSWVVNSAEDINRTAQVARRGLGLAEPTFDEIAKAVRLTDDGHAVQVAGEAGLSFSEAKRTLGELIQAGSKEDYNRLVKRTHTSGIRQQARSFRERGAISQYLAAERIATAFRRSEKLDEGVEALNRVAAMSVDELNTAVKNGDLDDIWNLTAFGDLTQDLPHTMGGIGALLKEHARLIEVRGAGIQNADDIFNWYRTSTGIETLTSKKMVGSRSWMGSGFELPRLTHTGRTRVQAKQWWNDVVDWSKDADMTLDGVETAVAVGHTDLLRVAQNQHRTLRFANSTVGRLMPGATDYNQLGGAVGEVVRSLPAPIRTAGRKAVRAPVKIVNGFLGGIHNVTTMLPLTDKLALSTDLLGENHGLVSFDRLVEFSRMHDLPSSYRRMAFDEFVRGNAYQLSNGTIAAGSASRNAVFRGLIIDMMHAAGVTENPQARKFMETWGEQMYGPGDIDKVFSSSGEVRRALIPGMQMSEAVRMPNFRDMAAYAQRDTVLRKVMGGIVNAPIVDSFFHAYWKPAMLLRMGFIPRAAGEEIASSVMRHGVTDYVIHTMAAYGSNGMMAVRKTRLDGVDVTDLVPRELAVLRPLVGGLDRLNRYLGARSSDFMARVARRLRIGGERDPRLAKIANQIEIMGREGREGAGVYLPKLADGNGRMWMVRDGDKTWTTNSLQSATRFLANAEHHAPTLGFWDAKLEDIEELTKAGRRGFDDSMSMSREELVQKFPTNYENRFTDVDLNKIPLGGGLSPAVTLSRFIAVQGANLPRKAARWVVGRDLAESAEKVNKVRNLSAELTREHGARKLSANVQDEIATEMAHLSAVATAYAEIDGVGQGGAWWAATQVANRSLVVSGPDGQPIILRFTRGWEEAEVGDPMFMEKALHGYQTLLGDNSYAVRDALEKVGGFVTPAQIREFETWVAGDFALASRHVGHDMDEIPMLWETLDLEGHLARDVVRTENIGSELRSLRSRLGHARRTGADTTDLDAQIARLVKRRTRLTAEPALRDGDRVMLESLGMDPDKVDRWIKGNLNGNQWIYENEATTAFMARGRVNLTVEPMILAMRRLGVPMDKMLVAPGKVPAFDIPIMLDMIRQDAHSGRGWLSGLLQNAYTDGLDAPAQFVPRQFADLVNDGVTNRQLMDRLSDETSTVGALIRSWETMPDELRALIAYNRPIRGGTTEDLVTEIHGHISHRLRNPQTNEEIDELRNSERMMGTADGRQAAMVRTDIGNRHYVPMLQADVADRLAVLMESDRAQVLTAIDNLNLDPSMEDYLVNHVLPFVNTKSNDEARMIADTLGRETSNPTVPVGITGTTDPDLAKVASQHLADALAAIDPTFTAATRQRATYGLYDLVDGTGWARHNLKTADGRWGNAHLARMNRAITNSNITPIDDTMDVLRYTRLDDGKLILDDAGKIVAPGVSDGVLYDDWATQLTKLVEHQLIDESGRLSHQIVAPGLKRRVEAGDIKRLGDRMPKSVSAPILELPKRDNLWEQTVQFGFDKVIGPAIRSSIRNPMFIRAYHKARAASDSFWKAAIDDATTPFVAKIAKQSGMTVEELIPLWDELTVRFDEAADELAELGETLSERGKRTIAQKEAGIRLDSLEEMEEIERLTYNLNGLQQAYGEAAAAGAMNEMAHFIDDHRFRSHMAGWARNIAPFWFAEETFLKRWARTLKFSPEALRRGQLYMGALRDMGFVDQDQYGQDVFVYPGSGLIQDVIGGPMGAVFGGAMRMPISAPMTGQVQYAMPGMDRQGIPSFSPLVAIPFGTIANQFPELGWQDEKLSESLFGARSIHNRSVIEQVFPAWFVRTGHLVLNTETAQQKMTGLSIQAIQQMEAEAARAEFDANKLEDEGDHEGAEALRDRAAELRFDPGSDALTQEQYLDNVRSWSRNLMMAQAVMGFFTPTTPNPEMPDEISQFYLGLTRAGMPFEEALGYALARDPGATPYTRFATESVTGAPLPTHIASLNWLDENNEWVDTWQNAGAWLMPQPEFDDEFSYQAYYQQMSLGLRERKTPDQFLADIKFAEAAPVYFASSREHDRLLDEYRDRRTEGEDMTDAIDMLEVSWSSWKESYFQQHPLFAERMTSTEGTNRRRETISQMRLALADPTAPDIAHREQISTLLDGYDAFRQAKGNVAGRSDPDAREFRNNLDVQFATWAYDYTSATPIARSFYDSIIAPELSLRGVVPQEAGRR